MYGAGIGSGNYGSCNNITINSGSVTASSTSGAGIGGGLYGSCKNITISGGSVNAQVGCTPHQNLDSSGSYDPKSPEVYLCVIPNTETELVVIDNEEWKPYNHTAVEPTNKNLEKRLKVISLIQIQGHLVKVNVMLPVIFLNLTVLSLLMMETHTLLTSLRRTTLKV